MTEEATSITNEKEARKDTDREYEQAKQFILDVDAMRGNTPLLRPLIDKLPERFRPYASILAGLVAGGGLYGGVSPDGTLSSILTRLSGLFGGLFGG